MLYEGNNQAVWAAQTDGHDVASATMQDDENLVFYSSGGDPAGMLDRLTRSWPVPAVLPSCSFTGGETADAVV